jgi:hypothetical protein
MLAGETEARSLRSLFAARLGLVSAESEEDLSGRMVPPQPLWSLQPDPRVEVPRSADLDHVEVAGQCTRER